MVRLGDFPEEGELVLGTVRDVKGFGAFITLDEYPGKEGFIHIAEVATGWVKYIRDFVREGQKVVCKVLKVDYKKGHVDLSLKQVNDHQRREKIRDWKNEKKAEKLFEIVGKKIGKSIDESYEEFGYELIDTFGSLYNSLETCTINESALTEEGFKGDWIPHFIEIAKENIVPPFVSIRGFIEITSVAPKGIEHIREALKAAEAMGEGIENTEIKVSYMGAPRYAISVKAPNYKVAEDILAKSAKNAVDVIKSHDGQGEFHRKSA